MRRRTLGIFIGVTVALLAIGFLAVQVLFPVHRDPPLVIGVELGPAAGQSSREILFETRYRNLPRIPISSGHDRWDKHDTFTLITLAGRQELPFLDGVLPDTVMMPSLCQPVQNTSLWVAAGFFEPGPQIEVVVFDPTGVRHRRTIAVSPDNVNPGHDFWFENGNATLRFRTAAGVRSYDVSTDTLTP